MLKFRKNSISDDLLPSYLELAKRFREKFGREMTHQERRLYELTKEMVESGDEAHDLDKDEQVRSNRPQRQTST